MTTINQTIQFRSAIPIENYYYVLDMVLQLYNSAGFHIKTIHYNGEFCAMMERVKDNLSVWMNFTNVLDNAPEADNRTILRSGYGRHITDCRIKALPRQLFGIFDANTSKSA
jgi:predicted transglutaminase-like protease